MRHTQASSSAFESGSQLCNQQPFLKLRETCGFHLKEKEKQLEQGTKGADR